MATSNEVWRCWRGILLKADTCLCYFQVQTFEAPDLWKARTTEISAEYRHAELARSPLRQFALFYIPCQVLASVWMPATSFGPLRGESFFLGFARDRGSKQASHVKTEGCKKNRQAKRVKSIRLVVDLHEPFFCSSWARPVQWPP